MVLAFVGAAALVVWLARPDEDGRAPERSGTHAGRTRRTTPVVDLAPPSSTTPIVDEPFVVRPRAIDPVDPVDSSAASQQADPDRTAALDSTDMPISIRGVRGLVRDAATHAPIPGAWLTWRHPDPWACEQVLGAGARRGDSRTGMVTDSGGRFAVERLADGDVEVASTLFAVATGYAVASMRPGLREEVVIDLEPMGALEVLVRNVPSELLQDEPMLGRVRVARRDDPAREIPLMVQRWHEGARAYRAAHLTRGGYGVRLLGRDVGVVAIEPGQTARLEVELPAVVDVQGVITGVEGHAWVRLGHPDGHWYGPSPGSSETSDWTGHLSIVDGRVSGSVHEGRYVAVLIDQRGTERRLPDVVEVREGRPLALRAPDVGVPVAVRVRANGVEVDGGIALVPLDLREDPCGPDLLYLEQRGGHAGPGRYGVFLGHDFAGEVVLPAGPVVLDVTPFEASVRWGLPAALREDEVLRGRLVVVPEALARDAALRRRYTAAAGERLRCGRTSPTTSIRLHVPGRYLLTGETDLGPFELWVDLAPGVEVVVPLGE